MSDSQTKPSIPRKLIVQIVSVVVVLLSLIPCACALVNIGPTIKYSQQTGTNYSLNFLLPLLVAVVIFGIGLLTLIITFVYSRKRE